MCCAVLCCVVLCHAVLCCAVACSNYASSVSYVESMTGITSVSPHQVVLQGTQDLWTFYADAAVAFEKSMSLLRGVYIDESQMEHDGKLCAYLLSEA